MAFVNTILKQGRHGAANSRRTGSVRPFAWLRHHGGAMTLPSQQAVDAISHSPDFPRH